MAIFDGVLLASDADGTLLNSKGEVTKPVSDSLTYFTENGGLFTVATGRSPAGFEALRPLVPLNIPAVLSNGACIVDYENNTEIHSEWLKDEAKDCVSDILQKFPGLGIEFHWPERICILNRNKWNDYHMRAVKCLFENISDISEAPPPWHKVLFVDEPQTLWQVCAYALRNHSKDFAFFFSAHCLLEMQNAGVDKSSGIRKIAEIHNISPENIYTIGDAGNDIGMLTAFESFAPASATEEALTTATHIVSGNNENAVAEVVEFLKRKYEAVNLNIADH